jgi:putative aldouronate transport system substrate-binding protein
MKMMSTKTIKFSVFLLLCLALPLSVFAKGQDEQSATEEKVTLVWYYPGSYPQADQDEVFAAANEIIQKEINTEIDFRPVAWGDYDQKMQVIIASGEEFDLCFTSNWINNYSEGISKEAFIPLDDLLLKFAPELYASVPQTLWNEITVGGKIYAVVNQQVAANSAALRIRKDLCEKYNFDPFTAKKIQDFEPFLADVKANEPDVIYPFGAVGKKMDIIELTKNLGFSLDPKTGTGNYIDGTKIMNMFKSDEMKELVEVFHDWYEKGYIGADAITYDENTELWVSGQIAMSTAGTYKPGGEVEESVKYGQDLYLVQFSPALAGGGGAGTMHAVSSTSSNPERAVQFLELMHTNKELYNLISWGIEGKHYKKLEGSYIKPVENSGYAPNTPWLHASTFNSYLLEGQPEDVWEKTKELNASAKQTPLSGFNFIQDDVNLEVSQVNNVIQEYFVPMSLGLVDPEEQYSLFLEKLKVAGIDKIIAEKQKQVDAFLAE